MEFPIIGGLENIHCIKAHTEGGCLYTFLMEDGILTVLYSMREDTYPLLKGTVTKINQPISLGGVVDIVIRKHDGWGKLEEKEGFMKSTRITRIEISE